MWIAAVLVIWYFIGAEGKKQLSTILTPKEAYDAMDKELEQRKKDGRISRWAKTFITENDNLFHHEGMPQHYQMGVEIVDNNIKNYKRGIVFAEGPTIGYATLQDSIGSLTGREAIPVKTPRWMDEAHKKYDMDWEDLIFGRKKK